MLRIGLLLTHSRRCRAALLTPGLFRVTPNLTDVSQLIAEFVAGNPAALNECDDPHLVAGVLLKLLRDAPKPLLPFDAIVGDGDRASAGRIAVVPPRTPPNSPHDAVRGGAARETGAPAFAELKRVLHHLSSEAREQAVTLFGLLAEMSQNSASNELTLQQISGVFGPAVCWPEGGAFMSIRHTRALPTIQSAVQSLIQHYDAVFRKRSASNASWASSEGSPGTSRASMVALALVDELLSATVADAFEAEPVQLRYSPPRHHRHSGSSFELGIPLSGDDRRGRGLRRRSSRESIDSGSRSPVSTGSSGSVGLGRSPARQPRPRLLVDMAAEEHVESGAIEIVDGGEGDSNAAASGGSVGAKSQGWVGGSSRDASGAADGGGDGIAAQAIAADGSASKTAGSDASGDGSSGDGSGSGGGRSGGNGEGSLQTVGSDMGAGTGGGMAERGVEVGALKLGRGAAAPPATAAESGSPKLIFTDSAPPSSAHVRAVAVSSVPDEIDTSAGPTPGGTVADAVDTPDSPRLMTYDDVAHVDEAAAGNGSDSRRAHPDIVSAIGPRPSSALRRRHVAMYRAVRAKVKKFEEEFAREHGLLPRGAARDPLKAEYAEYKRLKHLVREDSARHLQSVARGYLVRQAHPELGRLARAQVLSVRRRAAARAGTAETHPPKEVTILAQEEGDDGARGGGSPRTGAGKRRPASAPQRASGTAGSARTSGTSSGGAAESSSAGKGGGGSGADARASEIGGEGAGETASVDAAGLQRATSAGEGASTATGGAGASGGTSGVGGSNGTSVGDGERQKARAGASRKRPQSAASASSSSDTALTDLEAFGGGEDGDLGMLDRMQGADAAVALKKEKSTLKRQLKAFDKSFESKNGRLPTNEEKEPVRHLYRRYHQVKSALSELESESAWVEESAAKGKARDESVSEYRALRREKRTLQLKLKTYEDEFQRVKGRKVRYHRDIVPVEAEYQRYKEIKTLLQDRGGGTP